MPASLSWYSLHSRNLPRPKRYSRQTKELEDLTLGLVWVFRPIRHGTTFAVGLSSDYYVTQGFSIFSFTNCTPKGGKNYEG